MTYFANNPIVCMYSTPLLYVYTANYCCITYSVYSNNGMLYIICMSYTNFWYMDRFCSQRNTSMVHQDRLSYISLEFPASTTCNQTNKPPVW